MSSDDVLKFCPRCGEQDKTSFSKCRYCGTRYDARFETPSKGIDERAVGLVALCVMLLGGFYCLNATLQKDQMEKMKPVVAKIQMANRPRVIEFYANWCGPCRRYGPIVDAAANKYSDRIDFQRLNVDDPGTREMAKALGVSSIPKTCIFDRNGRPTASFTGAVSSRELEGYVQEVLTN